MSHDELIAKAKERLRWTERVKDKLPTSIDRLPRIRVRDAVVIDFTSDEDVGSIEVTVESESGKVIGAKYAPPKKKPRENKA